MAVDLAYIPKDYRECEEKIRLQAEAAFDKPFWEFHRKTEDRLRRRVSKKHPDMSYEDTEAIVAVQIFEMFENQPEKFFAHLPTASAEGRKLIESASAETLADDLNPQLLGSMVKWRI